MRSKLGVRSSGQLHNSISSFNIMRNKIQYLSEALIIQYSLNVSFLCMLVVLRIKYFFF